VGARQTTLRPASLALYRSFVDQQLKPRLGKRRLQTIDVDTVSAVIASLQKGSCSG
jgi:hypothetical protein